jgi:hypothetical protein
VMFADDLPSDSSLGADDLTCVIIYFICHSFKCNII